VRKLRPKFGAFESCPTIFHTFEAWVFWYGDAWREFSAFEVMWHAGVMSRAEFEATYSPLPELPEAAFADYYTPSGRTTRDWLRFRPRSVARQRFRPGRWRERRWG
jgi:hypothetical protein